ncbi:response regulator transcription factor [Paenibacillus sp. ACRRX]|uniref:response regulator transcription factor n=1 Tax=unclassified Paenibacillus TaxID=185978 RepID=UPI001EF6D6CC|nr:MULTISPECIES: response regulator transcription factor [unclassified Paenibacillus]MCG7408532.1 response regulator transcription factor [Paenibacillus sp. ACRRX]MDK8182780.1 response regulator transcription factor [Paenibacillus sp. UMB4589-SE434]
MAQTCRTIIVCDHPLRASALRQIVAELEHTEVIVIDNTWSASFGGLENTSIDTIIIDMDELNSQLEVISAAKNKFSTTKIIVLSDNISYCHMAEIGVSGIIPKKSTEKQISRMINVVKEGKTIIPISSLCTLYSDRSSNRQMLTLNEQRILSLVVHRNTNTQIAKKLFVSTRTVENHLRRIYEKLGVSSRTECIEKMNSQKLNL